MWRNSDKEVKEPVKIRLKELKSGSKSIYLDCYVNGVREDKKWNKEQMQLANAIKAQYIIDIQSGEFGFKDKNRTRKLNFIAYCEDMAAKYEANGQTSCAVLTRSAILGMVRYKGKNITFNHINKEFLIGYIDFLNNETRDFDKECKDQDRKPKPLSDVVYKEALFARIMVAVNQAERDGIIIKNPGKDIDRKLKPHSEQKVRCYLTIEEVKQIIECEYRPDNDVKSAFLFFCFSGLRFSDVKKMTWDEITVTNDGQAQLETKMKKTGKSIWVPL